MKKVKKKADKKKSTTIQTLVKAWVEFKPEIPLSYLIAARKATKK